jgi:hypothetical protein
MDGCPHHGVHHRKGDYRREGEVMVGEVEEKEKEFYTPPPFGVVPPMPPTPIDVEARRRETEILGAIQYILEPHIPEEYLEEFRKYEMLISRTLALSRLEDEEDVYRLLDYFDLVVLWIKFKKPDIAVKRICRLLMELQLRRSVAGFERISQISTRQIVEQLAEAQEKKKKRGWWIFSR